MRIKEPKISLGLMTHNELEELQFLFDWLRPYRELFHEVVVVDDFSDRPIGTLVEEFGGRVLKRSLAGDFSAQRNFLKQNCVGDFIFVLDPDEIPHPTLMKSLGQVIQQMELSSADVCSIPRLDYNYESDHFIAPDMSLFDQAALEMQSDDYQSRIVRNSDRVKWVNKLHERVVGAVNGVKLANHVSCCILHPKYSLRIEGQGEFYDSISKYSLKEFGKRLALNRLARRLKIIRDPKWHFLEL